MKTTHEQFTELLNTAHKARIKHGTVYDSASMGQAFVEVTKAYRALGEFVAQNALWFDALLSAPVPVRFELAVGKGPEVSGRHNGKFRHVSMTAALQSLADFPYPDIHHIHFAVITEKDKDGNILRVHEYQKKWDSARFVSSWVDCRTSEQVTADRRD